MIWESIKSGKHCSCGHLTGTIQDVNKLQKTKMQQYKMGVLLYSQSSRQYRTRTCETSECFIQVIWDVTLCHCMSSLWRFEGLQCLHLLDQACQEECLTPNVKTPRFFKMLGTTRQIHGVTFQGNYSPNTWCHVPKDFDLQQHCCENLKHCVQILN